jgi:FkbM family methyltransferase
MTRREFGAGVVGGVASATAWTWRPGRPQTVPEFGRLSFSEQGEDIVLYHALHDLLRIERPTYMDVGAAHPVRSNNTYLLYCTGSKGLLVEPNPMYVELLRRERRQDTVLAAGIGVTDAVAADYYEIKDNPQLNTFSAEQVAELQKGKTESVVARVSKMPLVNINRAIADHLGEAPDLLSTDIEGLDLEIIRSLDLTRFRPGVICCEGASIFKRGNTSYIAQYLVRQGYVLRGGSMVNSVFVDGARFEA